MTRSIEYMDYPRKMAALGFCMGPGQINKNRYFKLLFSKSQNGKGYLLSFLLVVVDIMANVLDPKYKIQTLGEAKFLMKLLSVRQWQGFFGAKILDKIRNSEFNISIFNLTNVLPICLTSNADFASLLLDNPLLKVDCHSESYDPNHIRYIKDFLPNFDAKVAVKIFNHLHNTSLIHGDIEDVMIRRYFPLIRNHQMASIAANFFYHEYESMEVVEKAHSFLEINENGVLIFSPKSEIDPPKELSPGVIGYSNSKSTFHVFVLDNQGIIPQVYRTGHKLSVGQLIVVLKNDPLTSNVQFDERRFLHLVMNNARPLLIPFVSYNSGVIFRVVSFK